MLVSRSEILVHLFYKFQAVCPENLHEINEEIQGMFDKVSVSPLALLNDHLGVPNDKATKEK